MKIRIPRHGIDTRVFDDSGKDITELLQIRAIKVEVDARGESHVTLEVYADVDLESDGLVALPGVFRRPGDTVDVGSKLLTNAPSEKPLEDAGNRSEG